MDSMTIIAVASIVIAGITTGFGTMAPAFAEGRAVATALTALAQQPATGGSPEHLLQDCDRNLSRALAGTPGARQHAIEAAHGITAPDAQKLAP